MSGVVVNIVLIFVFILIGGVFAAAEMSLVSLRDSQVKQLSAKGQRGATVARLASDPNRFLSAVQIGVTLAGAMSAAYGADTLAPVLAPVLEGFGLGAGAARTAALILITIVVSYFTIVFGELASKRLAMQRAEGFALALAPMVNTIAIVARPVIWFLGFSTDLVVRVLGGDPDAAREQVTDEEIRAMVSGSSTLSEQERQIVDDVFDAGERSLREVMIPRTEVDFLPGDMPAYKAVREIADKPHSRYPVTRDSADDIAGFVHVRDLFDPEVAKRSTPVMELVRPITSLPETVRVLVALSEMRRQSMHMAIVRDEYGGTAGIVTMEDLVEELVGDITDEYDVVEDAPRELTGTRELEGLLSLEDFADETGFELEEGPYDTLAGWFMKQTGRLPQLGDEITATVRRVDSAEDDPGVDLTFAIAEVDGRRAARITMRRSGPAGATAAPVGDATA